MIAIIHNMIEKFIETKLGNFVMWLSGSTTLLSILHVIPVFCGAIAAIVWLVITLYRLRSAIYETEIKKIELMKAINQNQICLRNDCQTRLSSSVHTEAKIFHTLPKS
jgi:hypothetical protein